MNYKTFDIYEYLQNRPLSWSAMSSFEYDPEQWFVSYILGVKSHSKEMDFGSYVDKRIQSDKTFLPSLPRYDEMQYKMRVVFNGIPLVGIPDGLNIRIPEKRLGADYKTGKKVWDQARADETGQLTFYALLLFISKKFKPESFDWMIHWMPTRENGSFQIEFVPNIEKEIKTFHTKRTMNDLLQFGMRINRTVEAMQEYVRNHA